MEADYGYILMKDLEGQKVEESFMKRLVTKPSIVKVHRGELLSPLPKHEQHTREDGVPVNNFRVRGNKSMLLYSVEDDISPLSGRDLKLLEAIVSPLDRFTVFASDGILDWGDKLRRGSKVYVKVPPSNNYAATVVQYVGPVKTLNGTHFGVEILDETYRGWGSTDGFFQGTTYFTCDQNCGLFVSLDKLSIKPGSSVDVPGFAAKPSDQSPSYAAVAGNKEGRPTHSMNTRSRTKEEDKSKPEAGHCRFKIGDRVGVASKHARIVHGTVRWAGQKTATRVLQCMCVGIHTDSEVSLADFESALPGMEYYVGAPKGHNLVVPQSLVLSEEEVRSIEKGPKPGQASSIPRIHEAHIDIDDTAALAKTLGITRTQLLAEQTDALKLAKETKEAILHRKVKEELGESIDITKQKEMLERYHRNHPDTSKSEKTQSTSSLNQQSSWQHEGGARLVKQSSVQPGRGSHDSEYVKGNTPPTDRKYLNNQQKSATIERGEGVHKTYQHERGSNPLEKAQKDPMQGHQPAYSQEDASPGATGAVVPPPPLSPFHRSLSRGCTIQLPNQDPARYGVIHWIGVIPEVQGQVAGIELEEPMEGCTDGSLLQTGKRFFNCEPGKGLYYPLDQLQPDQRFEQQSIGKTRNPLDYVPMEVKDDQLVQHNQIEKYLGDSHGIQGHQNSCYLDATVFGLFALNDTFDTMFLAEATSPERAAISALLWKGIVNTLRKNGVVRFESVMRLRDKLDELGQMKGIAQDEKDPEEFLNMLFKHTLQIEPFINIKRPFGEEQEYFVQLFVEYDETLKLPTVGDLLKKMFIEQKISFTQVPSKLLIQVPRFGKQFKTFKKIIPGLTINVGEITETAEVQIKSNCFICGEQAKKFCSSCLDDFGNENLKKEGRYPYFCEGCWGLVHKHPMRSSHQFQWCHEVEVLRGISELDLHSVICIETSHYVCFTKYENQWVFFDSMANRVYDTYNIPKVVECTRDLNEWVYEGHPQRLLDTPPRELPEFVRRFTQDVYLCVYIQPDVDMY